jgi:WS/DGAT/MGAT family acyltransferase
MSGNDAVLWHMEDDDTPLHTLKILILDPTRRGRPISLDDLALAVGSRLGLVPRATQKVVAPPGFGARPFWVDDVGFDLRLHLDERTLAEPGDAGQLDALYSELATGLLPRDRSPWAMTLVHGLEGGRQAVVARVHHAMVDGLGALNTFLAATTEEPGTVADLAPAATPPAMSRRRLLRAAVVDTLRSWCSLVALIRAVARSRRQARAYRSASTDLPPLYALRRPSLNAGRGSTRSCATGSLDLADMKAIGKASGTTVNGVLHALVAGAVRAELGERGDDVSTPCIASFGIASDRTGSDRRQGNLVTPAFVLVRNDLDDPLARLDATARSCRAGVELRRAAGLDLTDQLSAVAPRAINGLRRLLTRHTRITPGHLVTANVPGASSQRWIGDVAVEDWFSIAVAINPANVNLTVHSYDGRMNIGLVVDPAAMPDPHRFIGRLAAELEVLTDAVLPSVAVDAVA